MPWATLSIWCLPAFPFLHALHLVPYSDTSQPLFSHPFFPIKDEKAAILFFHPKEPKPLDYVSQEYLDFKTLF